MSQEQELGTFHKLRFPAPWRIEIPRKPHPCLGTQVFSSLAAPGAPQLTLHPVSPSACLLDLLSVLLEVPRISVRKIREMMESCSHTEYRQSFYLTLHSEGLLFHGPPYLILLLPPRLPLLLVHKPLLGNLAVEKRRRAPLKPSLLQDE
ncbi:hypothetical protein DUI87_12312 [Hirundo rustica rustica]|uniref:Uncharacterized protein n=1 Tax=Hirundo rustica rustica TaxID=333673 RepID=A0A3M0KDM1_HIRRU|nr:hypothetical protein DUI87_12312 [Hirundo rustica rustica]